MSIDVTNLTGRRATNRWDRVSVGDMWERVTWSYPEKDAIVAREGAFAYPEHERLTYKEADDLANRFANALLARGLERGDRVLVYCENSVEAYVAKIAVAKAGLVFAPVNPMLAPDVVANLIERVEPKLALVDDELWPKAAPAFAEAGMEPTVAIPILGGDPVPGTVSFADFVADAPATEPEVEIHGDDIWEIIFTSGTTAMPKAAMVSHSYSYLSAYSFALTLTRGIRFESELRLVAFLPLIYHIADQIFSMPAWLCGGTLIMGRKHDPAGIARALGEEQGTALWSGSPAMLEELARELRAAEGEIDASSLKVCVFGWTAIPPQLVDELKRLTSEELTVCEILGQTEAISCFRFWPDKWADTFAANAPAQNYVGVPNPLVAARLMDEDGNFVETPRQAAEVVYRSPVLTPGYYLDEESTREAFRGGWFHSGDLCELDEDGLRIMVDRSKDMIKSGGENVSTLRVEMILRSHPQILKAAVVGLPHERWQEAVTAIIVPEEGESPDPDEVIAFCRERLAGYESPKGVILTDSLPETVGGKVLKYKLRVAHAGHYEGAE
jgi:acyl-CoA synthetase (AMP-forming)/AMP-acid ligase II